MLEQRFFKGFEGPGVDCCGVEALRGFSEGVREASGSCRVGRTPLGGRPTEGLGRCGETGFSGSMGRPSLENSRGTISNLIVGRLDLGIRGSPVGDLLVVEQ